MSIRMSEQFVNRSRERIVRDICIKCKGENKTGYTMCESCADKVEFCKFEGGCITAPSEAVIKFSKSAFGKVLCFAHQPAQIRAREMARGGGNNE